MNKSEFAGGIISFKTKNDEEVQDDTTICEVTEVSIDGFVEIAFNDRDERCYLKFRLADLMQSICKLAGE